MSLLMSNDLSLFEEPYEAVLVGASGAIGQALCPLITADPQCKTLHTLARQTERIPQAHRETSQTLDFEDEESIETAFKAVKSRAEAPIRLILVVSGALHVGDIQPEKNWRQLDPASFHKIMTINALGPSLVAKHGLGLMPRKDKALFAAISARVGSISDNRLGGWYSYRASKSALNQILKTLSIEWARKNPNSICIGLHPGTVDSPLSEPFQAQSIHLCRSLSRAMSQTENCLVPSNRLNIYGMSYARAQLKIADRCLIGPVKPYRPNP